MSITDELREYADEAAKRPDYMAGLTFDLDRIADRIDAKYQKAEDEWKARDGQTWLRGYAECHVELMEGNEVIAADLEKAGWVRGPLDADGEMWHSGDMSDSNWGVIEGIAYENGRWLVSGHDISAPWIPADSIRHHHPPTVTDILREFAEKVIDSQIPDVHPTYEEAIAEYAKRLRLAGDAE